MLTMIAVIKSNNNIVGYRLLDDEGQVLNVSAQGVKNDIIRNPDNFANLRVIDGDILGSNGVIDRYTAIDMVTENPLNKESRVIIKRVVDDMDTTRGYIISDYKGETKKYRTEDVIAVCKENGIANGRIILNEDVEYISAIKGEFRTFVIERRSAKESKKDNNKLAVKHVYSEVVSKGNQTDGLIKIARNSAEDVSSDLDYRDNFNALNIAQRNAIKEFYIWYTVELFESLTHGHNRLKISPKKADKISRIRAMSENWKFAGICDTDVTGEDAHCEFGHKIRFKFFAVPDAEVNDTSVNHRKIVYSRKGVNEKDELIDSEKNLYSQGAIVFGEGCASDFFEIDIEDMKKLLKVRNKMSEEIDYICTVIENGEEAIKKAWLGLEFLCKCIDKIYEKPNGFDIACDLFGDNMAKSERDFRKNCIPYTMCMVLYMTEKIKKNTELFYKSCFSDSTAKFIESRTYLKAFVEDTLIDCMYMYNPYSDERIRRDRGGYNDKTRREFSDRISKVSNEMRYSSYSYDSNPNRFRYDVIDDCGNFYKYIEAVEKLLVDAVENNLDKYKGFKAVLSDNEGGSFNTLGIEKFSYKLQRLYRRIPNDFLRDIDKEDSRFVLRILAIVSSYSGKLSGNTYSYNKNINPLLIVRRSRVDRSLSWTVDRYSYSSEERLFNIKEDINFIKLKGIKTTEFVDKANEVIENVFSEVIKEIDESIKKIEEAKTNTSSTVSSMSNDTDVVNSTETDTNNTVEDTDMYTEAQISTFSKLTVNSTCYEKNQLIYAVVSKHPELNSDSEYRIKIALDIKRRCLNDRQLSSKQKYIIDRAYEQCRAIYDEDIRKSLASAPVNSTSAINETISEINNVDNNDTDNKTQIELMVEEQAMVDTDSNVNEEKSTNFDFLNAFKGIAKQVVEKDELKKNQERFKELSKKMSDSDISDEELEELKDIVKKLYEDKDKIDSDIVEFVEKLYEFIK